MEKEFKLLKLTLSTDHETGLENLLAILSEIQRVPINDLELEAELFEGEGTYFVCASNSRIANYLMSNPEERKILDMSKFIKHTLFIDSERHDAFYDIELIMLQNRIKIPTERNFKDFDELEA